MTQQATLPNLLPDYDCDDCGETINPSDSQQCSNCDHCESCCDCRACDHCGALNDETSRCGNCERCESGCCECWHCGDCGEQQDSDSARCSNCDHCESCCDCRECESCDRRRDGADFSCSCCDHCDNCCYCLDCRACGERVTASERCNTCRRCSSDCCSCGQSNEGVLRAGDFQFHPSKTFTRNKSRRFVSLEMEIASIDYSSEDAVVRAAAKWDDAIVEDGSLPESGFEINTNPTNGDLFLLHTEQLCRGLNSASAKVTQDCGMHCHVDARDLSYFDLFKLLRIYTRVEDGLYNLCAPSRRSGRGSSHTHYSKPCAQHLHYSNYRTFKTDCIARMYGSHAAMVEQSWDGHKQPSLGYNDVLKRKALYPTTEKSYRNRYFALNIHSFFYRRTVEFRHHQGTAQALKATSWGLVCAALLDSAARMTMREINALPNNPFEALLAVTPATLHEWMHERRANFGR